MARRVNHDGRTLLFITTIIVGVCVGLSGCSLFGLDKAKQMQTNLANQRKVAVKLVEDYPNPELESITFTSEGSVGGAGDWAAGAVIRVRGHNYRGILGTSLSSGDGLPQIASDATPASVTVKYTDGTSEILQ